MEYFFYLYWFIHKVFIKYVFYFILQVSKEISETSTNLSNQYRKIAIFDINLYIVENKYNLIIIKISMRSLIRYKMHDLSFSLNWNALK